MQEKHGNKERELEILGVEHEVKHFDNDGELKILGVKHAGKV